jgi:signal transduction histidine kinase/CheY-like chemotaxis protein
MGPNRARPPAHLTNAHLLRALTDLYALVRGAHSLGDILQALLDTAIACVPAAERGSLLVREGDELHYHAAHGYDLEQLRAVRLPSNEVERTLAEGRRVTQLHDYVSWGAQHLPPETNQILRDHGATEQIRSSLVVALLVHGRFYGTLVLDNLRSTRPFPASAIPLVTLFADHAGLLIEQALLLEELRTTNRRLVESEQLAALGRLVAGVAHEINNPLTAVLGHAELLEDECLPPTARESVEQIQAGARRVQAIVRNLQLFARQQHAGQQPVQLNTLVTQILALKSADLALSQIAVRTVFADDLPVTWGNVGQLGQVLLNLIVNAQDALADRPQPRLITVETGIAPRRRAITLRVADTGPGIPLALQTRIFEPFFSTKPLGRGTGLGLSVCYGVVAEHGGAITVQDAPGGGACFVVTLPVNPAPPGAEPPDDEADLLESNQPHDLRIAVIEDDEAVIGVIDRSLRQGNQLTVVRSGTEALALLERQAFDLVLCDLKLPGIDGAALFDRLRTGAPELARAFLFISGDTSSAATRAFLASSGRPLLHKPFTPRELWNAIEQLQLAEGGAPPN